MGVKNLLVNLKSITNPTSLEAYRGKTVGIDAKGWLHRAVIAGAKGKDNSNRMMFNYLRRQIRLLEENGILDAIFVFDGCHWKPKENEHSRRQQSKAQLRQDAPLEGNLTCAEKLLECSVEVNFSHVRMMIDLLNEKRLPFIIAPYEAGAQLAFLSKSNAVNLVITEDSDLIAYGCKEIIFKLDHHGCGEVIRQEDLAQNVDLCFQGWTEKHFQLFCCISGCDYLQSLPRIGIKTAHEILNNCRSIPEVMQILLQKYHCGQSYIHQLKCAMWTFRHQYVYNPVRRTIQCLSPTNNDDEWSDVDGNTLGINIPIEAIPLLVKGKIHPNSLEAQHQIDFDLEHTTDESFSFLIDTETRPQKHKWLSKDDHAANDDADSNTLANLTGRKSRKRSNSEMSTKLISPFLSKRFRPMLGSTTMIKCIPSIHREHSRLCQRLIDTELANPHVDYHLQTDDADHGRILSSANSNRALEAEHKEVLHWTLADVHEIELEIIENNKRRRISEMFL